MDCQEPSVNHHPHQLFCAFYPLNKSYSKKIVVGLEYDFLNDEYFKPVVRLLNSDFTGIAFSYDGWQELKSNFFEISNYFSGVTENSDGQKIYGTGWTIKFTRGHQDKAIIIEDDRTPNQSKILRRRTRRSIVLKRATFDCLNEYISKCIDIRLDCLLAISGNVSFAVKKIVEYIVNRSRLDMANAQAAHYTSFVVKQYVNSIDDVVLTRIVKSVESRSEKFENQTTLIKEEIQYILYEITSLHMYNFIDYLNKKIEE